MTRGYKKRLLREATNQRIMMEQSAQRQSPYNGKRIESYVADKLFLRLPSVQSIYIDLGGN